MTGDAGKLQTTAGKARAEPTLSLAGVFAPLPTPFTEAGEVAFPQLTSNLERWNQQPLAGYVVCGTNGESVLLGAEERVALVRSVRQEAPAERLVIGGSGMESTKATIALTARMAEAGADAALVITPSYYKRSLTAHALENHYRAVADASPIPVLLYSMPACTGIDLPLDTVVALSQHPNVLGIKDSGGSVSKLGSMVLRCEEGFQVLAGSADFFLGALCVGAVGAVSALANIAAEKVYALLLRFREGDMDGARRMQHALLEPNACVTSRFGVAGLKAAMDMLGMYGGPVRSPLLPLSPAEREEVRRTLQEAGYL
jgi:4-hydroxy-2-oxoglutarate aldolase